jgi:hypothetical protein
MKTVLFFDPNLNKRGTSIATYDYAYFNEIILGNKSIIASTKSAALTSYQRFNSQFETLLLDSTNQLSDINCDYMHVLKYGYNDGVLHKNAKNLIHVVFPSYDPHGDVYAYISKWLAETHGQGSKYVPHMINLPKHQENYREYFNIKNKFVVGWYGGSNFEIPFARQAVIEVAKTRSNIAFLFMNQDPFCDLENILFIEPTINPEEKVAFINTCDVMIHARERGETFGLAIAEFSTKNKPVITYNNSPEKCHISILGDKGIYYSNYNDLYNILNNIQKSDIKDKDWNCYQNFTPELVMGSFNKIFLTK